MSDIAKQKAEAETRKKQEEERRAKEAEEKKMHETPVIIPEQQEPEHTEPQKMEVRFAALLTTEDALALKEFFRSRNIEFRAI